MGYEIYYVNKIEISISGVKLEQPIHIKGNISGMRMIHMRILQVMIMILL